VGRSGPHRVACGYHPLPEGEGISDTLAARTRGTPGAAYHGTGAWAVEGAEEGGSEDAAVSGIGGGAELADEVALLAEAGGFRELSQ
jgi:hypothetical protein